MKKWVFGCAMALVITSCDNKKFSIQGRVADADGQVLYLESLAVESSGVSGCSVPGSSIMGSSFPQALKVKAESTIIR